MKAKDTIGLIDDIDDLIIYTCKTGSELPEFIVELRAILDKFKDSKLSKSQKLELEKKLKSKYGL